MRLTEGEDLDWKEGVDDVKDGKEFAKDVAAMANAAGGVIILGVAEDGSDHAERLPGLQDSGRHVQSLRGKASIVRPFIPGLRIYSVPLEDQPGLDLIVVEVPRSAEAPHLVPTSKDSWGFPKRRGTDTDWLGEREFEAAYKARFDRRGDAEAHLEKINGQLTGRLVGQSSCWLILASTCSTPASTAVTVPVDVHQIEPSVQESLSRLPEGNLLRKIFEHSQVIPKTGLRRAIVSTSDPYDGSSSHGHLELHLDGSFAGGLQLSHGSGRLSPEAAVSLLVTQEHLETAVRDLVIVAALHARRRAASGAFQARATIWAPAHFQSRSWGVTLTRSEDVDNPEKVNGSITQESFIPADGEGNLDEMLASQTALDGLTRQLALDLIHQFNVPRLKTLY